MFFSTISGSYYTWQDLEWQFSGNFNFKKRQRKSKDFQCSWWLNWMSHMRTKRPTTKKGGGKKNDDDSASQTQQVDWAAAFWFRHTPSVEADFSLSQDGSRTPPFNSLQELIWLTESSNSTSGQLKHKQSDHEVQVTCTHIVLECHSVWCYKKNQSKNLYHV